VGYRRPHRTAHDLSDGVSLLPFLGHSAGIDFGLPSGPTAGLDGGDPDSVYIALTGAFFHTVVEWSAVSVAVFTPLMAFTVYAITREVVTPIIGVALFCTAAMDGLHILAADRLISAVADNNQFIPFTWAISRLFNALILLVGTAIFLLPMRSRKQRDMRFILGISAVFGVVSFVIMISMARTPTLPTTMFPNAFITRPWDVVPLVLFAIAGLVVFPRFHRRYPSVFSHALVISAVPQVAAQVLMAFGATALYDRHFNTVHSLKVIAYLAPLIGLIADYLRTYRREAEAVARLEATRATRATLAAHSERLERSNHELARFTAIASHDLQEPLRKVVSFSNRLRSNLGPNIDQRSEDYLGMTSAVERMQTMISDLLSLSRVSSQERTPVTTHLNTAVSGVLDDLELHIASSNAQVHVGELPMVVAEPAQLGQLMLNLIGSALKFHEPDRRPDVKIVSRLIEAHEYNGIDGSAVEISVIDNGAIHERVARPRIPPAREALGTRGPSASDSRFPAGVAQHDHPVTPYRRDRPTRLAAGQTRFEGFLDRRPFLGQYAEVDAVPEAAIGPNHVIAQRALLPGADTLHRGPRGRVHRVRLELDSAGAQDLESMAHEQQLAFGIHRGALPLGRQPREPDFDPAIVPLRIEVGRATEDFSAAP